MKIVRPNLKPEYRKPDTHKKSFFLPLIRFCSQEFLHLWLANKPRLPPDQWHGL